MFEPVSRSNRKVLYAAFDAYPGIKGAQAHIRSNLRALAHMGKEVTLLCLGRDGHFRDPDSGAAVHACGAEERNMLRRSERFGRFLSGMADTMVAAPPTVIHFRDIWSGMPLLTHPLAKSCRLIFEVNGLPSVELPSHYPRLVGNRPFLNRLRRMEDECLVLADRVITVCRRTADYLEERGCDGKKIAVIPNAADASAPQPVYRVKGTGHEEGANAERRIILYVGTLAPWQGLYTLLEAMMLLGHREDCSLVVAASGRKGVGGLRRQVVNRGLAGRVTIIDGVSHHEIPSLYARAYLTVAPLSRGARNELQGCCPLKIVESMAHATPVVASDLPVVRELVTSGKNGLLVPPDSPRALAAALELLLDNEPLRARLAFGAVSKARVDFGTKLFGERLAALYENLTGG